MPGPKTFTEQCSRATVTGTISVQSSLVVVQLTVLDDKDRTWTVKWGNYDEQVGSETLTEFPGTYLSGAAQVLGDTDDGTHRSALLRPDGQRSWCELKMHAYWLW